MKRILGLTMITLVFITGLQAATTTYNINSNTTWSASLPSYCSNCIINVSPGITLTLDNGSQCANCTFTGGTLKITAGFSFNSGTISNTTINAATSFNMYNSTSVNNIILNMSAGSVAPGALTATNSSFSFTGSAALTLNNASSISNTNFTFSGSGGMTSNGTLTVSNSTLTFNNSTSFTGNGQLDLNASFVYLNGNSNMLGNSAVNLKNGSKIVVGDGSKTSGAYLYLNNSLNLQDASSYVVISNTSNYLHSWSGVNGPGQSYSTVVNNNPNYYGGAMLSSTGILPITILPIIIGDLKGTETSQHSIKLSWTLTDASGRENMQIERSNDAVHFTSLSAVVVNGSNAVYTYTDESPDAGENDYRIKLTDADGKISYSKIIQVRISSETNGAVRIYPNPCTNGNFQVQLPSVQPAMIRVFSLDGKLLYMSSVSGQDRYSLNINGTGSTRLLVVQIISKEKTSSFNLLNTEH